MSAYCVSRAAALDLKRIVDTSLRQFGPQQADRYRRGIERVLLLLAENPRIARIRTEVRQQSRGHPSNRT